MGKMGFNCQLLLSEIGLTTDSSHSTWFHKTVRFSRSKASSEEDLAQHVLFDTGRRRTRLGILLPSRHYLRWKDDSFGSTWESNYIALSESMLYIWKRRGWPPCFSHGTILFPLSPLSPRSTETKCRTGANSSSRKKGLAEPRSLTNTNLILMKMLI